MTANKILESEWERYCLNNKKALQCEEIIYKAIKSTKSKKKSLLIRAFALSLIKYFSSYILAKDLSQDKPQKTFPYLDSNFIKKPYLIKFKKKIIKQRLAFLFSEKKITEITTTYRYANLIERILSVLITWVFFACYLPLKSKTETAKDIDLGMSDLQHCLMDLSKLLELNKNDQIFFINNFISYAKSFKFRYPTPLSNELFSGNVTNQNAALRSCFFLFFDSKVCAHDHGLASIFIYDEPIARIGEALLPTRYKTYGNLKYVSKLLYYKNQKYINIPKLESLTERKDSRYHKRNNLITKKTKSKLILYCPTSFSGIFRYSPYRDFSDYAYLTWQNELINNLISSGYEVIYKAHPKNKVNLLPNRKDITILNGDLKTINLSNYHAIALDYVSTVYGYALINNKSIWYFDIGLRKLHNEFYDSYRKKNIKQINFSQPLNSQIKKIISIYEDKNFKLDHTFYLNSMNLISS